MLMVPVAMQLVNVLGQVMAASTNCWFRTQKLDIMPGSTIVVPTRVEKWRPLPLWTTVTIIIYNPAVAVAAVSSF